jgi:hypothetical protein
MPTEERMRLMRKRAVRVKTLEERREYLRGGENLTPVKSSPPGQTY